MRIIVLFNLKEGTKASDYETWARMSDIPTANGLASVNSFTVHKATGLFGDAETKAPYQYIEVLDINDMDGFVGDVSKEEFQQNIAARFGEFADNPLFITTEDL